MNGKMKSERAEELMKDPKKGLFKLALPIVAMMFIQTLFNIIDTFWVGKIGPEAIAALTLAFPIAFLMIAVGSGIGTGVTSLISRFIGAGNKKGADNAAEHGIILSLVTAALFTIFGLLFVEQIFLIFGLSDLVLQYSIEYMSIIFAGSIFMFFTFFASSILRGEGDVKTPTKLMTISIILNIILDPIFIFGLGMGVAGAAIATILSRAVSSGLLAYFLFVKKGSFVKFNLKSFKWNPGILKNTLSVGIPSSFVQMSNAFSLIVINVILAMFGTAAIAAFGLYIRIEALVILPIIGIAMALITMIGMYTGSKQYDKLKNVFNYTTKLNILIMSLAAVFFFVAAEFLMGIFTSSPEVIEIGVQATRFLAITLPFAAVGITASVAFQGMGKGMPALAVTVLRVLVLVVPLAYILALVMSWGLPGIWWAFIISSPITAIVAYVWFRSDLNKMAKKKSE